MSGLVHGFPWGDHPRAGARSLVIADGDAARAEALAKELAAELFAIREGLNRPHPTIETALDRAMTHESGTDRAGGRRRQCRWRAHPAMRPSCSRRSSTAASPMPSSASSGDPMAMRICREAGEGARGGGGGGGAGGGSGGEGWGGGALKLRLGGKYGPMSGDTARPHGDRQETRIRPVAALRRPARPSRQHGLAGVRTGVDIVVNDLRTQTFHPEAYTGLGHRSGVEENSSA